MMKTSERAREKAGKKDEVMIDPLKIVQTSEHASEAQHSSGPQYEYANQPAS